MKLKSRKNIFLLDILKEGTVAYYIRSCKLGNECRKYNNLNKGKTENIKGHPFIWR